MDTCRTHPQEDLMELEDGSYICVACEAAQEDEQFVRGERAPSRVLEGLATPSLVDHQVVMDALKPVTMRLSQHDRERARVLAKWAGISSYQTYIKKLITEGLDRDERRMFGARVGEDASPTPTPPAQGERARPQPRHGGIREDRPRDPTRRGTSMVRAATTSRKKSNPKGTEAAPKETKPREAE